MSPTSLNKLDQLGVPSSFLDFLNSYLESREGYVTVEGAFSECMFMANMVYQGIVLGHPLWNAFFADVATEVPDGNQHAQVFADDLKVDASCPLHMSNDLFRPSLQEAQSRMHTWYAKQNLL